jgi:RNA recognition motif-containing protein
MLTPLPAHAYTSVKESHVGTRIYVGNLPFSATGEQLQELFGPFGDVVEARVITDRSTGQSKGFGFVEMSTEEATQAAIAQLNGTTLDGRTLRVNEAEARPDRPRRDGGSRGGYGGGYGGDRW